MRTHHSLGRAADTNPAVSRARARAATLAATASLAVVATLATAGCSVTSDGTPTDARPADSAQQQASTTEAAIVSDSAVTIRPGTASMASKLDADTRIVSWGGGGTRPRTADAITVRIDGHTVTVIPASDSGSLTIGSPTDPFPTAGSITTPAIGGSTARLGSAVTLVHVHGDEISAETVPEAPDGSSGGIGWVEGEDA